MDENTNAEELPRRTSPSLTQSAPVVSAEFTTAFDPSTKAEDTSAGQVPASEPPATEADQLGPILDNSLSFLQPGTQPGSLGRLGHYEVLELLGKGGFGIVFKGFDDTLQRLVAIKVLGPQLARNATARSRFVREARAAAAVNSKYVVSTYAVEEQPIPYLVMEYVAGKSLQDRIEQTGSFETRDILRIGAEIAEGLAAAHKQGLIHRDIKPANILREDGPHPRVKIADFGLARAVDDSSLTQSGVIAGTPMFMSPEQARGETLDHRTDLFSLGSVLYVMCTGQPPFRAERTLGVLKRVCDDVPHPIRELNPGIPDSLAAIVNMLLVKEPSGRFQTAAAVAELLEQHLAHLDDPALPSPSSMLAGVETVDHVSHVSARLTAVPSPKKQGRWKWVAAGALILPVLALALTKTTGITRLFGNDSTPDNSNKPGSEALLLVPRKEPPLGDGSVDVVQPRKLPSPEPENPLVKEPEKPIVKEPVAIPATAEENPFKKANVGDKVSPLEAASHAARGDWKAAVAVYARVFAVPPVVDGHVGFEYAAVLLLSGNETGYRKFCAEMLGRSGQRGVRPYHAARACTLAPDSVKDPALPGKLAANELEQNRRAVWSPTELGALAYRAGRYDEAATLLEQSLKADRRPGYAVLNWLWLSLVEHRRGKPAEARAWLEKAKKWLEQYPKGIRVVENDPTGLHLHNWLEAKILCREAERALALEKRVPAPPRAEDRPK